MKKHLIIRQFAIFFLLLNVSCIQGQEVQLDQIDETLSNISTVKVEGSFCNVNIKTHSVTSVKVDAEIRGSEKYLDEIKFVYNTDNSTLSIKIEKPKSIWGNLKGYINLVVPSNTNVYVNNSSGDVNVEGIGNAIVEVKASSGDLKIHQIDSDLLCSTSSGDQHIQKITGSLKTHSSSGSQYISNVERGVDTKASSGSIELLKVKGNVNVTASSGTLRILEIEGDVHAKASSGSIHINKVNGNVNCVSSSGSIRLNTVQGALTLKSSSGSQGGSNITLTDNSSFHSSSGSIRMSLSNDMSELSFNLNASSGSLRAKGSSGHKSLKVGSGSIKVKGVSSSGSQSYD